MGGLNSIQIIKKSNSYRVLNVRLYGPKGNKNISGKTLRRKLKLLSNKFDVDLKFNQINQDNKFNLDKIIDSDLAPSPLPEIPIDYFLLVKGYGAGHGVGMSQWGARAMAERGASFNKILKHYYTGVQIKTYR